MRLWRWALLIFELALFVFILILPQAELPDVSFHGGSAPVELKARGISLEVRVGIVVLPRIVLSQDRLEILPPAFDVAAPTSSDGRLSLLCTFLC